MTTAAPPSLDDLRARLPGLMARDAARLRKAIDRARTKGGDPAALAADVERAEAAVERRRAAVPALRYPEELPITALRAELVEALRSSQVVIVAGETGSGKSTQLPKLCLEAGRGVLGLIGHTQPRRIAARTIAERVAEELGVTLGEEVGYAVRFTDKVGARTMVKLMTDGILLAELQRDRDLTAYDTIIVDEAHERSLNVDFILGYLRRLLPRRPDLKVVVTSATIDTQRFSEHFGGAPIVEVSGRGYPVEVRYRPYGEEPGDDRDQTQAICDAVEELAAEGPGDVLVFLSGEREIRDTAEALVRLELPHTEVLPLFARLSAAEQHRVFQPHRGRRVVLATNVAETSITVPGVRGVVDTGLARISRYHRRLKVQRLPIEAVSRASADQRAGRCGRVGPGTCIRLYSEEDLLSRPEFTEPEILRTNLASVILQMTAIGLGDVAAFPFVDPPDARAIRDGVLLLEELGALEPGSGRLTRVGRRLAQLPLDPRLGRMVLEAEHQGCVPDVLVIAAALSIPDPRERPSGQEQAADEQHRRFTREHPDSDLLAWLDLWDHLQERQRALSSSQFRKLCRAEFLGYLRVREWQDLHSQLRQVAKDLGLPTTGERAHPDHVHQALLSGLLSHVGMRSGDTREFRGAREARFTIAPGSVLAKKPPRWVVAAELVETNRLWARGVAKVQPEWAERLGGHLVKRSYDEPTWDPERGAATTIERVSLYGLPIVSGRRIPLDRVDPEAARDMFLWHALVERDWAGAEHHAFLAANAALVEELQGLEHRARRGGLVADRDVQLAFYAERVPADVTSGRRFDRWWKDQRAKHPDLLAFTRELLLPGEVRSLDASRYPEVVQQGDVVLHLTYEFDPTSELDGVAVHVPLPLLNQVTPAGFDWQVPGLRDELVPALIRSLPKHLRRQLVPVSEHADAFLVHARPRDGALLDVLAADLSRAAGERIGPRDFDLERVPPYLRVTFVVEDEAGQPVAHGKDLEDLKRRLSRLMRTAVAGGDVERTGLTSWSIGELPAVVERRWKGQVVTAYPALVDEGETVGVRLFAAEADQARAMWAGTRRLLLLGAGSGSIAASVERRLTNAQRLALSAVPDVLDQCVVAAVEHLMREHGAPAWDATRFDALQAAVRASCADDALALARTAAAALTEARALEVRLDRLSAPALAVAVHDVHVQLARLVHPRFVEAAGAGHLPDLPRYLEAIGRRLDRVAKDPRRDAEATRRIQALEERYARFVDRLPPDLALEDVDHVRWMLEELRVSTFAQTLGTPSPVSEARVARELTRLGA